MGRSYRIGRGKKLAVNSSSVRIALDYFRKLNEAEQAQIVKLVINEKHVTTDAQRV